MPMLRPLSLLSLLLSTAALAQVPTRVNFTARLSDANGPVQGTRDFTFKLFPTLVGGSEVWTEQRNAVTVTDGMVNLDLGASTPLADAIFDGQVLYLEVQVGTTVLAPRTQVLSVPYALRSTVAARLGTLSEGDVQRRVAGSCPGGSAIRGVDADGGVLCETIPTPGGFSVNAPLTANGSTISLGTVGIANGGTGATAAPAARTALGAAAAGANSDITSLSGLTTPLSAAQGGTGLPAPTAAGGFLKPTASGWAVGGIAGSDLPAGTQVWASSPTCAAGSAIRSLSSGGTATCEAVPAPLTAATGGGLNISAGAIGLLSTSVCPTGSTMRVNSSNNWACMSDLVNVTSATGGGIIINNSSGPTATIGLVSTGCPTGSVMKYILSGTSNVWACTSESVTSVGVGTGLVNTGSASAPVLNVGSTVANWPSGAPTCPANQAIRSVAADGTVTCAPAPAFVAFWANCAFSATSGCSLDGQYLVNSGTQAPSIVRNGVGDYTVSVPSLTRGVPSVSTHGIQATVQLCRIDNWNNSPHTVRIRCHTAAGTAVDSNFSFSAIGTN